MITEMILANFKEVGLVTTHLRALYGAIIQFGNCAQIFCHSLANDKVVSSLLRKQKKEQGDLRSPCSFFGCGGGT